MLSFIVFMALYIRITAKPKAIKKSNKILTKSKFIRKHELRANIPEPNKKILHIFTESSLLAYLDIRTFRSFSVYVFFPHFYLYYRRRCGALCRIDIAMCLSACWCIFIHFVKVLYGCVVVPNHTHSDVYL